MKRLLPFLFLFSAPVYADIKQEFVTSAQISIDSPYVITNAAPSSYSISGNNITTSTGTGDSVVTNAIGGLNLGSLSNGVPALVNTNKTVKIFCVGKKGHDHLKREFNELIIDLVFVYSNAPVSEKIGYEARSTIRFIFEFNL